jgi:hypothetical protein
MKHTKIAFFALLLIVVCAVLTILITVVLKSSRKSTVFPSNNLEKRFSSTSPYPTYPEMSSTSESAYPTSVINADGCPDGMKRFHHARFSVCLPSEWKQTYEGGEKNDPDIVVVQFSPEYGKTYLTIAHIKDNGHPNHKCISEIELQSPSGTIKRQVHYEAMFAEFPDEQKDCGKPSRYYAFTPSKNNPSREWLLSGGFLFGLDTQQLDQVVETFILR